MIRCLFLVSKLTFLDFGILGDITVVDVCLKNDSFKSCFQQSAKCKMTAHTRRKHHVLLNFIIGFATKTSIFK